MVVADGGAASPRPGRGMIARVLELVALGVAARRAAMMIMIHEPA